jgi:hypothetical protein
MPPRRGRRNIEIQSEMEIAAKGASMTQKSIGRGARIAVLSVALATQGLADKPRLEVRPNLANRSLNIVPHGVVVAIAVGIVVAAVAVVAVVAVLVMHHKRQRITGCIHSGANGMSVTDEKDNRIYVLSGSPAGVKPGYRVTLEGKRKDTGKTLVFEAHKVTMDFGACQP